MAKKKGKGGKKGKKAKKGSVVRNADMAQDMQEDAIKCVEVALATFKIEQDIAAFVKKEFDKKYGPTWHCVVGRNFGSNITYEMRHFIHFFVNQLAILLFRC